MKTAVQELKPSQARILLYTKNHYNVDGVDFLTGIRRIWAARCGLLNEHTENGQSDEYIADDMYRILTQLSKKDPKDRLFNLHRELANPSYQYRDLNPIEMVIMIYRSELSMIPVKRKVNVKWRYLIKLPKVQKRAMKRIVAGKGEYEDWELVCY